MTLESGICGIDLNQPHRHPFIDMYIQPATQIGGEPGRGLGQFCDLHALVRSAEEREGKGRNPRMMVQGDMRPERKM